MKNKNATVRLKESIKLLEEEQELLGQLLIKQFHLTYESLKPVNLLKSTINEVVSSPYLMDNILGVSLGMATGYLSKKIVVSGSDSKIKQLFGSVLQLGITNIIAKNPQAIKSFGQSIINRLFHKNEEEPAYQQSEN